MKHLYEEILSCPGSEKPPWVNHATSWRSKGSSWVYKHFPMVGKHLPGDNQHLPLGHSSPSLWNTSILSGQPRTSLKH